MCRLSCHRCPFLTALSWLSCHGYPAPVLSLLLCSGHSFLSFLPWMYYPDSPLRLFWPSFPVPAVPCRLSCLGFPVPAVVCQLSFPNCLVLSCPVQAVLSMLSTLNNIVPSSFSPLFHSCCHILIVMFYVSVLSLLACPSSPPQLSYTGFPV
jgi:hypothetical protein